MFTAFSRTRRAALPQLQPDYTQYVAQHMRPVLHALMLVAVLGYVAGTITSALAADTPLPLWLRLAPVLPLLLVAAATARQTSPLVLSLLALACATLLEIGISLNGIGREHALAWVLPGYLLVPVASAIVWPTRWSFLAGMGLSGIAPIPLLCLGNIDGRQALPSLVYMAIAIAVSSVLRAFTGRMLLAQFQMERQLREQAGTDDLTGLLLRNRFVELASEALERARRDNRPASMLFLDVDHFKQINDAHGHADGDRVLMALADQLRRHMRSNDLIGRLGGEEFAMLLPGVDLARATERAERLRVAVHRIQRPDGPLTVSIGVVECLQINCDIDSLLARSDQAMRQAKKQGRDQTVTA